MIPNLFDWCLKVFILLSPIIMMSGFTQNDLQLLFFNYGAILLFGLSLALPPKREFKNYNISILLLFSSAVILAQPVYCLSEDFLNIIFGCLLYYAIVRSTSDIKGVLKWLIPVFFINAVIFILQMNKIDFLYKPDLIGGPPPVCGLMAQQNHLAMFVSFIAPILALFSWFFLPLAALILIILDCHCATAGFILILLTLIFFYRKDKKKTIGLSVLTVICLMFFFRHYFQEYHFSTRMPAWKFSLKESFANPFIGHGLGSFAKDIDFLYFKKLHITETYNEYFRAFYDLGIVPTVIFLLSVFHYFKKIWVKTDISVILFASVIPFLGIMGFQDPLHIVRLAVPFLIIAALFEASLINGGENAGRV
jgi:hypothetical protein